MFFSRQTEFMTKLKTETEEGKSCEVQLEAKQGIFQSFTVSFFLVYMLRRIVFCLKNVNQKEFSIDNLQS